MYTSEKNTKQLTVRGGGSTLTVSLTVKYPGFFLTTSLIIVAIVVVIVVFAFVVIVVVASCLPGTH